MLKPTNNYQYECQNGDVVQVRKRLDTIINVNEHLIEKYSRAFLKHGLISDSSGNLQRNWTHWVQIRTAEDSYMGKDELGAFEILVNEKLFTEKGKLIKESEKLNSVLPYLKLTPNFEEFVNKVYNFEEFVNKVYNIEDNEKLSEKFELLNNFMKFF